jgi:myo-inositol-1(or 4)-monophosphatase
MNAISPNLNLMIKASEKASKILIRDFGEVENLQISEKGPSDFVTNTDIKVEKILIDELSKSKKKFSILSEESGFINNKDNKNIWIIDPIDGTSNFLHGIPHFAISIALQSYNEITCGLIFDPIKNEMFYAEKNNGSYINNKRIRVSKRKDPNKSLFATNGIKFRNVDLVTRKSGSAALDMAYVASGRYDGFFQEKLNLWDVAAGLIIVKEAGGIVNLNDLSKNEDLEILASSSSISEKMLEKLNKF